MRHRIAIVILGVLLTACSHPDRHAVDVHDSSQQDPSRTGSRLLILVEESANQDLVQPFIGERASFVGFTAYTGDADLMLSADVRLHVKVVPERNVLPRSMGWQAFVTGVIRAVDVSKSVITIEVRPEDYQIGDTI